jgi:hypothetical protein
MKLPFVHGIRTNKRVKWCERINKKYTYKAAESVHVHSYATSGKTINVEASRKYCTKCKSHTCLSNEGPIQLKRRNKALSKQKQKRKYDIDFFIE